MTHDEVCEVLAYDEATGTLTWKHTRGRIVAGSVAGTVKKDCGYREVKLFGKAYRAHRLIWFIVKKEWPPEEIDHKNGSRDDNKWENLRLATKQQNQFNRKTQRGSRLGVKGVHLLNKGAGPYLAHIRKDGKLHRLGLFNTLEEARAARAAAEKKIFGEFSRLMVAA